MNTPADDRSAAQRALAATLPVAAWFSFAPLGLNYPVWLACAGLASWSLLQEAWGLARVRQVPGSSLLLSFFAWMMLSALWSPAAWPRIGTHLWMYGLPLLTLPIIAVCPGTLARRALAHFASAAAAVGVLTLAHAAGVLTPSLMWHSTVDATGNQRIVTSLLLAIGGALALWFSDQAATPRRRVVWLLAGAVALGGLASQDRRTGMLALPVMLLAWALMTPRRMAWRSGLLLLVVALSLVLWTGSAMVRARFGEGAAELQAYRSSDDVTSSWGQRVRMLEHTAQMVAERPLIGHGVGGWSVRWRERVDPTSPLAANTTPHNEFVLVAAQAGVPAMLLLLGWMAMLIAAAARAGRNGVPAVMIWSALLLAGFFNAVLRDAKFALPLLLLVALTGALVRESDARRGG